MVRKLILSLLIIVSVSSVTRAEEPQPMIVPQPKSMQILGAPVVLEAGKVAIVIGAKASEPEQYAAQTLQNSVRKRYGQEWPVVSENFDLKGRSVLVVLGQKSTNTLIDPSCRDLGIDLSEQFPVQDGYALAVGKSGDAMVAVVAGSNARSVVYGQDTLFQLMYKDGQALKLWPARIKDWPSLPHRGRVCTSAEYASNTENLDAAVLGRMNFIDIRYGIYGTSFDAKLDHEKIKKAISEAHRRGLLVYGTVSLVARKEDYDRVIAKFQEFIDLGVDGLWPYLGDPGGYGRSGTPLDLIERVVELGKKHGMTGDLIHYTPGKRGYVDITNPDNYTAARVPGMEEALWFFATKPTPESAAQAAALGLKKKYVWWDHWPHPRGGFSSCGNVGFRPDKPNIFADLHALSDAYQRPQPQEIVKATEFVSGVIPWGGTIWLQETILGPIGWWAWSPETHDWQQTRRRIYDYLYGPELVKTAFEFNDLYESLRSKNIMCDDDYPTQAKEYIWPPLLREGTTAAECLAIIDKMYAPLEKLKAGAAAGTMRDIQTLEKYFFEPAVKELEAARAIVQIPRVEYWWKQNEERILLAIREGNTSQALKWHEDARRRVLAETAQAENALAGVVNNVNLQSKWVGTFEKLAGDAAPLNGSITLDGRLDEPAWSTAPKLGPFRIYNDSETYETPSTAQVLYGDDALYIGLVFEEPNMDMIVARNTEHDSDVWEEDCFEVYINTDGLGRPYYRFVANALGTMCEGRCVSGEAIDDTWNGTWSVKTAKLADRWLAEVCIPYATLGVSRPEKDEMWMFNFGRTDKASPARITHGENWREQSAWGYKPRGPLYNPSKFRPIWFR